MNLNSERLNLGRDVKNSKLKLVENEKSYEWNNFYFPFRVVSKASMALLPTFK